jgi:hypothetical protein
MGKRLLSILGLVLAFAATVRADVTVSDGSITNFENAVSNVVAAGGGTITVTRPITIGGTNDPLGEASFDGESVVTVSGGNTNAIFIVQSGSMELANMTISGGLAKFGGAISISNGAAGTFTSCTFANNRSIGADGASAISNTNGGGGAIIGKSGPRGAAGGPVAGGAIYSLGDLGFFECTFVSNSIVGGTGGDGGDGQSAGTRGGNGGGGGAGGAAKGGAVCSLGETLVISNCTFSGNSAEGGSGGVGGVGGGALVPGVNGFAGAAGVASGGGLFSSSSDGVILNSTFNNNSTQGGDASTGGTNPSGFGQAGPRGGDALGAGLVNTGTLSVTNSTFYQNSATGGTGGDGGVGGVKGGAGGAGGSAIGGGIYNSGKIMVVNCTFSKGDAAGGGSGTGGTGVNTGKNGKAGASFGGNIANVAKKKKTGFTLANSIIGEATSGKGGYGTIKDGGYNISADKSIKLKKGLGSLMNTNALEGGGDIADNGGPTETIALADDSPAVDLIPLDLSQVTTAPPTSDQRQLFNRPIGNGYDVGAYELDQDRVTIRTQPASTNVIVGSNATFSVTVGGTAPFFYQWFFNGTAVANQTNSSILITNAQTSEAGNFLVVVTNSFNSATSKVAVLTVSQATNSLPVITQEPVLQLSVPLGSNATFSVAATSDTPLFYQWMFLPVGGTVGADVPNGTNATLLITNAQPSNQGQYQATVSNMFGFTNSTVATLFVTNATTDTNQPGSPGGPGAPGVPGIAAKAKAKLKAAPHKSVSMNGGLVPDAEPNRPARRQFAALGNSFPEPRRNVTFDLRSFEFATLPSPSSAVAQKLWRDRSGPLPWG